MRCPAIVLATVLLVTACHDTAPPQNLSGPLFSETADVSISGDALGILFGPVEFLRGSGEPDTYTTVITGPGFENFWDPYWLHIHNGELDGEVDTRTSSATISLDGVVLFGSKDFSKRVSELSSLVPVIDGSNLTVTLGSSPGTRLTVWVEGTRKPANGEGQTFCRDVPWTSCVFVLFRVVSFDPVQGRVDLRVSGTSQFDAIVATNLGIKFRVLNPDGSDDKYIQWLGTMPKDVFDFPVNGLFTSLGQRPVGLQVTGWTAWDGNTGTPVHCYPADGNCLIAF
jgi:hypothetical protein